MKKFIYIPNFLAIIAGLLRGESFEGRLFIDKETVEPQGTQVHQL